jgi:pimeloyl-ACP methyl ester carboxylesterase
MDHYLRSALRFEVIDSGPADGEAVVLLHGFPQQPFTWEIVADQLNAAGLRTLVPTLRGYTATSRPRPRRPYAATETTADVVALLDAAGLERAHIVGHDWGAGPAWGMGSWHPDRAASLTVLSTPHPAAFVRSLGRSGQALRSWYMAFFQLPAVPEAMIRPSLEWALVRTGLPADWAQAYAAAMSGPGALTGAINWYRGIPFTAKPFRRIRVPTTYVWGRHDPALGRYGAEATAAYVTGPYTFVELDAGHWLPELEPEAVSEAILARIAGTAAA